MNSVPDKQILQHRGGSHRPAQAKDRVRGLAGVVLFEGFVIIAQAVFLIAYANFHVPADRHYMLYDDGKRREFAYALRQPNLDPTAVAAWASLATCDVMSFGFHNYRERLAETGPKYFTKRGWQSFQDALAESKVTDKIFDYKQILTTVPKATPIIISQGSFLGDYTWVIQVPIKVNFLAGNVTKAEGRLVTLTIVKRPTIENPRGVGIEFWSDQPM